MEQYVNCVPELKLLRDERIGSNLLTTNCKITHKVAKDWDNSLGLSGSQMGESVAAFIRVQGNTTVQTTTTYELTFWPNQT